MPTTPTDRETPPTRPPSQDIWNAAVRAAAAALYHATAIADRIPGAVPAFETLPQAQRQVFITAAIVGVHRLNTVNHHLALSQAQAVAGGNPKVIAAAIDAYFYALGLPVGKLRR